MLQSTPYPEEMRAKPMDDPYWIQARKAMEVLQRIIKRVQPPKERNHG